MKYKMNVENGVISQCKTWNMFGYDEFEMNVAEMF